MDSSYKERHSTFLHQKGRRYSLQSMKDTLVSPNASPVPDTVSTGPISMLTSRRWWKPVRHANDTAHINHDNLSNLHQHLSDPGNTYHSTTLALMDLNTSHHGLLHKDAICKKNASITVQQCQDDCIAEGTICRTWDP